MLIDLSDGVHGLLDMHACAANARVLESVKPMWAKDALCLRNGTLAAQGPGAVESVLIKEFGEHLFSRVVDVMGQPTLVAYDGPEGRGAAQFMLRLETDASHVTACRIDHVAGQSLH